MKTPFIPLVICAIVVWLCWGKLSDYQNEIRSIEKKRSTSRTELNQLRNEENATAGERSALEESNRGFAGFLGTWQDLYSSKYSPSAVGTGFSDHAEKAGVFVVENKIEPYKGKFMGHELTGTSYRLRAIGGAAGLFRFLGGVETDYELVGIRTLTISRNLSDIIFEGSLILPEVTQ